jgi:BirA family transcriptional regulator, biotin operon repressor / biotin---[acetyl-CoA-carboxylase] ligase
MTCFVPRVLHYESLPSTNTEAARLAIEGASEGLSVVADEQTAGRGRLARSWSSPKGAGLYLSILLRPKISQDYWPLLTFVAALAVGDAVSKEYLLETDIKWPNDLLAGERKFCGILAEVVETSAGRAVVIGTGVNLTSPAVPEDLRDVATSISEASGQQPDRDSLLSALLVQIDYWYSVLQSDGGPARLLNAWMARSSYAFGKPVRVRDGERTLEGITQGLDGRGGLILQQQTGEIVTLMAGDVMSLRALN